MRVGRRCRYAPAGRDRDRRRRSTDTRPSMRLGQLACGRRRRGRRGRGSRPGAARGRCPGGRAAVATPSSSSAASRAAVIGRRLSRRSARRGRSSAARGPWRRGPPSAGSAQALRPSRRTVTASQISSTSSSLWLTKTMRDALVAQLAQEAEQRLGLVRRQRGGGLVEQQHARAQRQRLGDLDELHLGDAEPRDRRARVEVEVEQLEPAPRLGMDAA